jgi:hypothetical protein
MKNIRIHLAAFVALLLLSGITAFPIGTEIEFLFSHRHVFPGFLEAWIAALHDVLAHTPAIMFYGTDWLAFAHIVIALFFVPVFMQPARYRMNLVVGMVASLMVFPLAFVCGPLRGIPFFHQLIDCAFGAGGFVYLYYILNKINKLDPAK